MLLLTSISAHKLLHPTVVWQQQNFLLKKYSILQGKFNPYPANVENVVSS